MDISKTKQVEKYFDKPDFNQKNAVRSALRSEIVRDLLGPVGDAKILDAGCGNGLISLQFLTLNNRITMVDLSRNMLASARENTPEQLVDRVEFFKGDILDYSGATLFDIVLCIGVLAHVASIEATVDRLAGLLKAGGTCILQFTDQGKRIARLDQRLRIILRKTLADSGYHKFNRITFTDILQISIRHGLQPAGEQRYGIVLPGMGFIPDALMYKLQNYTRKKTWLSKIGSEVIIKLIKVV